MSYRKVVGVFDQKLIPQYPIHDEWKWLDNKQVSDGPISSNFDVLEVANRLYFSAENLLNETFRNRVKETTKKINYAILNDLVKIVKIRTTLFGEIFITFNLDDINIEVEINVFPHSSDKYRDSISAIIRIIGKIYITKIVFNFKTHWFDNIPDYVKSIEEIKEYLVTTNDSFDSIKFRFLFDCYSITDFAFRDLNNATYRQLCDGLIYKNITTESAIKETTAFKTYYSRFSKDLEEFRNISNIEFKQLIKDISNFNFFANIDKVKFKKILSILKSGQKLGQEITSIWCKIFIDEQNFGKSEFFYFD